MDTWSVVKAVVVAKSVKQTGISNEQDSTGDDLVWDSERESYQFYLKGGKSNDVYYSCNSEVKFAWL